MTFQSKYSTRTVKTGFVTAPDFEKAKRDYNERLERNRKAILPIEQAFDPAQLARRCEMTEQDYKDECDASTQLWKNEKDNSRYFIYIDNGSDVLAMCHLDTVQGRSEKDTEPTYYSAGPNTVHSPYLDDRLGAYTILDLLPALGITTDILLCTDEEMGRSTASLFNQCVVNDSIKKQYRYLIEFDRAGEDVVLYQFDDCQELKDQLRASNFTIGHGSFSDVACMDNLGVAGCNIGVGYKDYHSANSSADLDVYFRQMSRFVHFYHSNLTQKFTWEYKPKVYNTVRNYDDYDGYRGYGGGNSYYNNSNKNNNTNSNKPEFEHEDYEWDEENHMYLYVGKENKSKGNKKPDNFLVTGDIVYTLSALFLKDINKNLATEPDEWLMVSDSTETIIENAVSMNCYIYDPKDESWSFLGTSKSTIS